MEIIMLDPARYQGGYLFALTDDSTPQGWNWGDRNPGFIPGLVLFPVKLFGQMPDTALVIHPDEDISPRLVADTSRLIVDHIGEGLPMVIALTADQDSQGQPTGVYRLTTYFENLDALGDFKTKLLSLPSWDYETPPLRLKLFD